MLRKMLAGTAFALALACLPALASETECTISVCEDATWPEMEIASEPLALDQHAETDVIEELVASHIHVDESVTDHEQTLHMHQVARLDEAVKQMERP